MTASEAGPKEREHRFERVEKFLRWMRRRRIARRLPDQFLKPVDYLINVIIQYNDYRNMLSGFRWSDRCRLPGERDHFRAGFVMSIGPLVCH